MPKGFALIYLLLGLVVLILAIDGVVYLSNNSWQKKTVPVAIPMATILPTPTPTPNPWKIYKNDQYNFSFNYPEIGMVAGEDDYVQKECGQTIKKVVVKGKEVIKVDNFLDIKIIKESESIEDYLKSIRAFSQYDTEPINNSLADEAIKIIGLKKGAEYAVGYPPLIFISHIYRKNNNLFLISKPQAGGNLNSNPGGCINPEFLDPVKHAHLKEVYGNWDFSSTFRFD